MIRLALGRMERIAARHFWAVAVRCHNSGDYSTARRFSRLAGAVLGVELAAPVSVGLGGVL